MIGPASRLLVSALVLAVFCSGHCSNFPPCQLQCSSPCDVNNVRNLEALTPNGRDSASSLLVPSTAATNGPAAADREEEPMSSLIKRVTDVAENKALAATQVRALLLLQQRHVRVLLLSRHVHPALCITISSQQQFVAR